MRVLLAILGFLVGLVAGVALLLANPLAALQTASPLDAQKAPAAVYRWESFRGMAGEIPDLLGLPGRAAPRAFGDPALQHTRVGTVILPAGDALPAALGVKVTTLARGNALWRAQLATRDYWCIFRPGEGSLFASATSNFWAYAGDQFRAAVRGAGRESLAMSYPLTAFAEGRDPRRSSAGVIGAAGRYAGLRGEIREVLFPSANAPDWTIAITMAPPVPGRRPAP
jgi:hypothetical protein